MVSVDEFRELQGNDLLFDNLAQRGLIDVEARERILSTIAHLKLIGILACLYIGLVAAIICAHKRRLAPGCLDIFPAPDSWNCLPALKDYSMFEDIGMVGELA